MNLSLNLSFKTGNVERCFGAVSRSNNRLQAGHRFELKFSKHVEVVATTTNPINGGRDGLQSEAQYFASVR